MLLFYQNIIMMSLIITFLAMLCLGIGFTIPLCKDKENIGISFFLAPVIGYSIMSVAGMFYINYSLDANIYYISLISLTATSLLATIFWIIKNNIFSSIKLINIQISFTYCAVFIASLLLIDYFLNPIKNDLLFHRLASDLPSYLASSKHLLDGGNLSNANNHIFSNEIFIRAFRWGFPAVVSFTAWLNNTRVEYIIFYLPLITYVSGLFASFLLLSKSNSEFYVKRKTFFLLPIVMIFNAGIIFYLFEGFYPQIISISIITLIMSIFFGLRKEVFNNYSNYIYFYIIVISASLTLTYSEAYVVLILAIGGILFLDLIFKNKSLIKYDLSFLLLIIASNILIFPFISKFIFFTLANAANVGNIGFTFPSSPIPSDWVGITNIFSDTKIYLDDDVATTLVKGKGIYPIIINIALSIWVTYELTIFFIKKNSKDKALFLVPVIGIICFFITNLLFTKFLHITSNYYLYNKTLTLFLPLVTYCFFSHLYRNKNNLKIAIALILFGLSLILFFKDSRTYKSAIDLKIVDYFQSNPNLSRDYLFVQNERGNRNGVVVKKYRYIDRASDFILYSLINITSLDQWESANWKNMSLEVQNREIIILANSDNILQKTLESIPKDKVIFKVGKYIAISTGIKLSSITAYPQDQQYHKLQKLFIR
jgi:hypothetical protein